MTFYEEPRNSAENRRETVYHTGNGFYNPYVEPAWKRERRLIRNAANGIGLASLGYAAISLLSGAIYAVAINLLYPAANIHGMLYVTETIEWLFTLLTYVVSLVIPFGIYTLCIKMPVGVALPFRKAKTDITIGGTLVGLGIAVLASYAVTYLQIGLESIGIGITMPEYEVPETVPGIMLYVLLLTVAPAFLEEMVFRGVVMQSLRRFGDIFALVSSALIFGIFHLNLIQMPYAFIMGLCIGYFVMRTGSLWVGIIIHFINNSTAVVFEFLYPKMTEEAVYLTDAIYALVCVLLSIGAFVFLLLRYKDMFRFEPSRTFLPSGKRTTCFITAPLLIMAMIMALIMTLPYIYII